MHDFFLICYVNVCHTSSLFFSAWDCPSYAIGMFYHWTTSQPLHFTLRLKDQHLLKKTSNQTKRGNSSPILAMMNSGLMRCNFSPHSVPSLPPSTTQER